MELNPDFKELGLGFVEAFYKQFDDPKTREEVAGFYSPMDCLMSFEGEQIRGCQQILQKFRSMGVTIYHRVITAVDAQPTYDGGVLIHVLGKVQCDEKPGQTYSQVFVLHLEGDTFYVTHDIFRLHIQDTS